MAQEKELPPVDSGRPLELRHAPANLDESRHQQRCQDTECAEHGHQPYRERRQHRYEPPIEPGHPDWDVVWGFSHLIPPRRARLSFRGH
jgi:hypothetical protein